jgi:putative sigma-54 modulation protein
MQLQLVSQGFSITSALRDYLERRLRFALSTSRGQISEVAVRFRDLNGPRGGRDMMCQVAVGIVGSPAVIIKEVREDMYTAIDLAVKRAAYRVMDLLARRKGAIRRTTRPGYIDGEGDVIPDFSADVIPAKAEAEKTMAV